MESRSQRDVRLSMKVPEEEEVGFNFTCGLCFISRSLRLTQFLNKILSFTKGMVFCGSKEVFLDPLEVSFTEYTGGICFFKFQNKRYF